MQYRFVIARLALHTAPLDRAVFALIIVDRIARMMRRVNNSPVARSRTIRVEIMNPFSKLYTYVITKNLRNNYSSFYCVIRLYVLNNAFVHALGCLNMY